MIFVLVTGVVVVAIMLGLVAMNALLAQASFKIGDLQNRVAHLTQSYEERKLEAAELSSPAHLAHAATRLGLVVPQGGVTVLTAPNDPTSTAPRSSGKAVGGAR